MTWLAFALSLLAFACFGFATDDHHHRLTGRRLAPDSKTRWQAYAWFALMGAFGTAVASRGWAFGPVLWLGAVMLSAGIVFLSLNLRPQRGRGTRQ